jgi:hypothetical protein
MFGKLTDLPVGEYQWGRMPKVKSLHSLCEFVFLFRVSSENKFSASPETEKPFAIAKGF